MLNAEHRNVENMREVFDRLRALALGRPVFVVIDKETGETECQIEADARYMGLYLDRVLGPVKEIPIDLTDAPDEALEYLRAKLRQ